LKTLAVLGALTNWYIVVFFNSNIGCTTQLKRDYVMQRYAYLQGLVVLLCLLTLIDLFLPEKSPRTQVIEAATKPNGNLMLY